MIIFSWNLEKDVEEEVEVQEGESLEDIKAKLKPKKSSISPEMLDTANTYDDKVAVVRMLVGDEAGKISNVFRQLLQKDDQTEELKDLILGQMKFKKESHYLELGETGLTKNLSKTGG